MVESPFGTVHFEKDKISFRPDFIVELSPEKQRKGTHKPTRIMYRTNLSWKPLIEVLEAMKLK